MSRTTPGRRSVTRALSGLALALLSVVAGGLAACGGQDPAPGPASSRSATASASPPAGQAGETKLHMIDNGGHRLAFYVTRGNGSTIVLDSGGGEYSTQWKDIASELHAATGATIITYDRSGLGKSDVVPGPWKVEGAVSDLKAGLDQLGVAKDVTLVSHSQAGEIANYFAKDHPKMLSGAVLIDANLPQFFTDQEIPRLVAATQPEVDAAKKDPEKPENRQLIATAEGFAAAHKAFHGVKWPDAVPVTVMVSEKTPFAASPEGAQRWRDAAAAFVKVAPNRTLVTAAGTSHEIPTDRPDLVLKAVEDLYASHH
ncbi:alpha/beta fold hydrolase [Streptomyces sp. NBC_01264]|uniref:alpha/beta fold hydrolase n=1 Tax=Streptomyces sp. NBC_01264 TaxID=2903804 RepID=UPI0022511AEA|nr:alpha/beta hydrolase [Streptomyces sp. NBC_01264]MCX4776114.1 alpha/beta hydrolase [Streptomyces sp. NBC_01264]